MGIVNNVTLLRFIKHYCYVFIIFVNKFLKTTHL